MAQDYGKTLNLPKTDFPMRANLPQNEPKTLEKWESEKLYNELLAHNEGSPPSFFTTDLPSQTVISIWVPLLIRYSRTLSTSQSL